MGWKSEACCTCDHNKHLSSLCACILCLDDKLTTFCSLRMCTFELNFFKSPSLFPPPKAKQSSIQAPSQLLYLPPRFQKVFLYECGLPVCTHLYHCGQQSVLSGPRPWGGHKDSRSSRGHGTTSFRDTNRWSIKCVFVIKQEWQKIYKKKGLTEEESNDPCGFPNDQPSKILTILAHKNIAGQFIVSKTQLSELYRVSVRATEITFLACRVSD